VILFEAKGVLAKIIGVSVATSNPATKLARCD